MAYDTIGFKDKTDTQAGTPLDAANFNKMDEQIKQNADDIDGLSDDLAKINVVGKYYTSADDLIADATASLRPVVFTASAAATSFLTNGGLSAVAVGVASKNASSTNRFIYILTNGGGVICTGNVTDGELTGYYRYSGTSALSASSTGEPVVMGEDE